MFHSINNIDQAGGTEGVGVLGGTFCGTGGECYCNGGYIGNGKLSGDNNYRSDGNVLDGGCCNRNEDCASGTCEYTNVFTNGTYAGTQNYVCGPSPPTAQPTGIPTSVPTSGPTPIPPGSIGRYQMTCSNDASCFGCE